MEFKAPHRILTLLAATSAILLLPTGRVSAAPVLAGGCTNEVDVIFYVDNSGSVSDAEFADMSTSIRSVVDTTMPAAGGPVRAAVVHYGSPAESWESKIWIEQPFSDDPAVVKNFVRRGGGLLPLGNEDYAAESLMLVGNALDKTPNPGIISPQQTLSRRAGVPLVVFFFTDALRDSWGSALRLSSASTTSGSPAEPFKPFNDFKRDRGAAFIVVHVDPGDPLSPDAAAAIGSVGGTYTGPVEINLKDPQGSEMKPRWYFPTSFILSPDEVKLLSNSLCNAAQSQDHGDLQGYYQASSVTTPDLHLGATVDAESTAQTDATATADDLTATDDEDGVTLPASLVAGVSATVPVTVTNATASEAWLNGWIDWNRDGDFDDAGEAIVADQPVAAGTVNATISLTVIAPATLAPGVTGVRFRLTDRKSPGSRGLVGIGEVEDYIVGLDLIQLSSTLAVRGQQDTGWVTMPQLGSTMAGGRADWQITVTNVGSVGIRDAVILDILPAIGDTGIVTTAARGSQWEPVLAGPVSAPPGVTVYYGTARKLGFADFLAQAGAALGASTNSGVAAFGAFLSKIAASAAASGTGSGWSPVPPTDITTVRSLKFDFSGTTIDPGESFVIEWPMRAPVTDVTTGSLAWNSFSYTGVRADTGASIPPAETTLTGISIIAAKGPFYGDRVWLDADGNHLQGAGETGISGLRVDLFRDNGNGIADALSDTMVGFTVTGSDGHWLFSDMPAGGYFAVIQAPGSAVASAADQGSDNEVDSDGTGIVFRGRRAAILPVTPLSAGMDDRSWDQGFTLRSGYTAVWAVVEQPDRRILLGGDFAATHGVPRNNIARVDASGAPDLTFKPGTGFDSTVNSLALTSSGRIWAGGSFATYNGQRRIGVALLNADGSPGPGTAQPDSNNVRWVGTGGSSLYFGGSFAKVGGLACGNFARLLPDGSVDADYISGGGANGTVYDAWVREDGVIAVGAFTQYNGCPAPGVVKIKPDGSVDPAFCVKSAASGEVYSIKPLDDGRMLLTGNFQTFGNIQCNGTIRLYPDGKVDDTLSPSPLAVQSINSSN